MKDAIDSGFMRRLVRAEATIEDLADFGPDWKKLRTDDIYEVEWEDLEALVRNLRTRFPSWFSADRDWNMFFFPGWPEDEKEDDDGWYEDIDPDREELERYISMSKRSETVFSELPEFRQNYSFGDPRMKEILLDIASTMNSRCQCDSSLDDGSICWDDILSDIGRMKNGEDPVSSWNWTDSRRIEAMREPDARIFCSPAIPASDIVKARGVLVRMCEREKSEAIEILADATAEGSYLFPEDRDTAIRAYTRLLRFVLPEDVGSVAYRLSDLLLREGDTDEAVKYLSYGSMMGHLPSRMRLAEIMAEDEELSCCDGVVTRAAVEMLPESFDRAMRGKPDSAFPEAAAAIAEDGMFRGESDAHALALAGLCVLKERMEREQTGRDNELLDRLDSICENTGFLTGLPMLCEWSLSGLVDMSDGSAENRVRFGRIENISSCEDELDLILTWRHDTLLVDTENGRVVRTREMSFRFTGVDKFKVRGGRKSFTYDSVSTSYPWQTHVKIYFRYAGETVCRIRASRCTARRPLHVFSYGSEEEGTMHKVASVVFTEHGRTVDCLADGFDLKEGDTAYLEARPDEPVRVRSIREEGRKARIYPRLLVKGLIS